MIEKIISLKKEIDIIKNNLDSEEKRIHKLEVEEKGKEYISLQEVWKEIDTLQLPPSEDAMLNHDPDGVYYMKHEDMATGVKFAQETLKKRFKYPEPPKPYQGD